MKLKKRAKQLKIDIPATFIALRKKETPMTAKILAAITIMYALSPIDLIPDFVPGLGYLDDLIILPGLIAITVRLIPPDLFEECRNNANGLWKNENPKKWYFAIPIIAIWCFIIYFIQRVLFYFVSH